MKMKMWFMSLKHGQQANMATKISHIPLYLLGMPRHRACRITPKGISNIDQYINSTKHGKVQITGIISDVTYFGVYFQLSFEYLRSTIAVCLQINGYRYIETIKKTIHFPLDTQFQRHNPRYRQSAYAYLFASSRNYLSMVSRQWRFHKQPLILGMTE